MNWLWARDIPPVYITLRPFALALADGGVLRCVAGRPGGPPDPGEATVIRVQRPLRPGLTRRPEPASRLLSHFECWESGIGTRAIDVRAADAELSPAVILG